MKKLIVSYLVLILFCLGTTNAAVINVGIGDEFSSISISGSDSLYMDGGIVHEDIRCYGNSTATFYGGTIVGLDSSVFAEDFSSIYIYGGEFKTGVWARDNGHYYIYGGEFGEYSGNGLVATDSAVIDIFGYDFSITEEPGEDPAFMNYHLSGKWEDGTPFNIDYGGYEPFTNEHINLHVVPEPTTFLLFGLGGLLIRKRT